MSEDEVRQNVEAGEEEDTDLQRKQKQNIGTIFELAGCALTVASSFLGTCAAWFTFIQI